MRSTDEASETAIRIAIDADTETDPTAHLAARELRDHLHRATGTTVVVIPPPTDGLPAIRLGIDPGIGASEDPVGLDDAGLDDAVAISVHGDRGTIIGRNPRSLLIAVYRYLRELGFRWLRPGPDGEHQPRLTPTEFSASSVQVAERAALRHRGICIEGSTGLSQVVDLVDWLPKVGLNSYFVQFVDGGPFLRAWYTDSQVADGSYSPEAAERARARIVAALEERGLVFHAVGHGWTTAAIGLDSTGWDTVDLGDREPLAPLALVSGKRELWQGIPANTELCYSDPRARSRFVGAVVEYARAHPEVDLLHIWLSDGTGNHCECDACSARRPADWYVVLLNEIDAALTEEALPVRLAALAYHQLLWAPQQGEFTNPDRFCHMFAPISRDYREPLPAEPSTEPMPPYPGNAYPSIDLPTLLASQRAWREFFAGDSFVFDYHFMWQYVLDPGMTRLARIVAEDIRHYRALGINGLISCQSQRTFLPDGTAIALYAQLLWDLDTDVESWIEDNHRFEYGAAAGEVGAHLQRLGDLAVAADLNQRDPGAVLGSAEQLAALRSELERFLDPGAPSGLRPGAWTALSFHDGLWLCLVDAVTTAVSGQDPESVLAELTSYAFAAPPQLQSQFDARNVALTAQRYVRAVHAAHATSVPA